MAMQENISQLDDVQVIFQKDTQPLELAVLSTKEMKETEGAVVPVVVVGMAVAGGVANGISYWAGNTNPNMSGLAVAVGTGALGGAAGGIPGLGIATFGGLYANTIQGSRACTGKGPCILPK
jgi:hypothetical protein